MLTNAIFFSALMKIIQLKLMDLPLKIHTAKNFYFDDELKFDFYFEELCKNANRKLRALPRVAPYMDLSKKRILMNAFFDSQFNYCPLIRMCHSRKFCHEINRLHGKCLRIIYNDKTSSYEDLLSKDGSVSMHHKNLRKLVIEFYKVASGLCPEIMNEVFQFQIQKYRNLRNSSTFRIPSFNTIFKRKEVYPTLAQRHGAKYQTK